MASEAVKRCRGICHLAQQQEQKRISLSGGIMPRHIGHMFAGELKAGGRCAGSPPAGFFHGDRRVHATIRSILG